jgi:hypothetical protein
MGVVFGDVEATVVPPVRESQQPEEAETPAVPTSPPLESFFQHYTEHQRRTKRLWAD